MLDTPKLDPVDVMWFLTKFLGHSFNKESWFLYVLTQDFCLTVEGVITKQNYFLNLFLTPLGSRIIVKAKLDFYSIFFSQDFERFIKYLRPFCRCIFPRFDFYYL